MIEALSNCACRNRASRYFSRNHHETEGVSLSVFFNFPMQYGVFRPNGSYDISLQSVKKTGHKRKGINDLACYAIYRASYRTKRLNFLGGNLLIF